jgi:glycosyltransferase involved in cell wall biosynthesis
MPLLPLKKQSPDTNPAIPQKAKGFRLLIVQYAGDYRQAYYNLAENGTETYYAQRYSVELLADYKQWCEEVATLIFKTSDVYDETLPNGVRSIGAGFLAQSIDDKQIVDIVQKFQPTHLILRTPHVPLLNWAIRNRVRCLVTLADSFQSNNPKQWFKHVLLGRLLNNSWIDWVANHGLNSSLSLQSIGVNASKIIPWDWPAVITPAVFAPKAQVAIANHVNLFFAGAITEAKGVGDVLRAIPWLQQRNISVSLKIAGSGEVAAFQQEAQRLGITDSVEFLGLVPHHNIINLMREADVVLIPSRHEYPEGLPMTIYEALCSRTPIVASDHPMFRGRLQHEESALIFPQGNSTALGNCIDRLVFSPPLYERLSVTSEDAWKKIQIAVKWGDIVERWLVDSPENRRWLAERCLNSGLYQPSLPSGSKENQPSTALPMSQGVLIEREG